MRRAFLSLAGWRLVVYPAAPLLLYSIALQFRFPQTHDLVHDWYLHPLYFTMFVYGWWMGSDDAIWAELARIRQWTLGLGLAMFLAYIAFIRPMQDDPPYPTYLVAWTLRSLYVWLALCAILGWGHALLDRPFKWLPFATEAVYPWYILHQSLIVLLAYWLIPLRIGPVLEPAAILVGTVLGCWALHVHVIARVNWLRPCFGLRERKREAVASPSSSLQIP